MSQTESSASLPLTSPESVLDRIGGYAPVLRVVRAACDTIMEIYGRENIEWDSKGNGSPVTEADLASAAVIEAGLAPIGIPIVCEEDEGHIQATNGEFWLVDPLDGTKEFLSRNGEFTVNVALVRSGVPIFGVIAIPVTGEIFTGVIGGVAHKVLGDSWEPVYNRRTDSGLIAAVSRSHGSDTSREYLEACGVASTIMCGSAIKFCRLASGECDIYARFGRTMEWDTAAGQCILEASGCKVVDMSTGNRLAYGKTSYANPSFVACRAQLVPPRLG